MLGDLGGRVAEGNTDTERGADNAHRNEPEGFLPVPSPDRGQLFDGHRIELGHGQLLARRAIPSGRPTAPATFAGVSVRAVTRGLSLGWSWEPVLPPDAFSIGAVPRCDTGRGIIRDGWLRDENDPTQVRGEAVLGRVERTRSGTSLRAGERSYRDDGFDGIGGAGATLDRRKGDAAAVVPVDAAFNAKQLFVGGGAEFGLRRGRRVHGRLLETGFGGRAAGRRLLPATRSQSQAEVRCDTD